MYAAEKTVKDALFFEEIEPFAREVGRIGQEKFTSMQAEAIRKRFSQLPPDLQERYLKEYLRKYYPEIANIYFPEN